MKCPHCKAEMLPEGIPKVHSTIVYRTWICPACKFVKEER